ncbi:cytochrome c oxidase subunit IV-domain-containing protein [Blyttiomyces helicus]|uniref:Cytochrome c oxidase subunit IV-domain-containing protein n=1 Tax=Blyttiomyces helicus TaxID=388810 RepID=A0A4V1IS32_9FUNG|nr:cytochrome c oxidase subunit IV-domain-containing protein [Blyttiomyces helicus]|eukprot:RKO92147.1 cytochrome c oxidase subunit IV-domain-containing protein [Blyttiomyces helicus]
MARPTATLAAVAQRRAASTLTPVSLSSAALNNIESRWYKLPECEKGAIADVLAEAQKGDWKKLTLEQKRAAYWIAYGQYGARAGIDPTLKYKVAGWVSFYTGVGLVAWYWWINNMKPELRTTTPEWIEATKEKDIEQQRNPFTGPFAEVRKANKA